MIQAIDHINIVVSDLSQARNFFIQFGFEEVSSSKLGGEKLSVVTGLANMDAEYIALAIPGTQTKVELIQYFQPQGGRDPLLNKPNQLGFRHVAFTVKDIEEEVAKLKQNGVRLESEIQVWEKTGKKLLYFYGPDDIILEFCEYPEKQT